MLKEMPEVGDKIRYISRSDRGLTKGRTYEITGRNLHGRASYEDNLGRSRSITPAMQFRFELISKKEDDNMTKLKKGDFVRYLGGDPNDEGELTVGKVYEIMGVDFEGDSFVDADNGYQWFICAEAGNLDCFVKVFGELDGVNTDESVVSDYEKKTHTFEGDSESDAGDPEDRSDAVNHPQHYTRGKYETIDVIAHMVEGYENPFVAHCVGTATKYLDRAPYKHESPAECLRKAVWYLTRAAETIEGDSE